MLKGGIAVGLVLGLAGCGTRTKNVRLDLPGHATATSIAGRAVVLEPAVDVAYSPMRRQAPATQ